MEGGRNRTRSQSSFFNRLLWQGVLDRQMCETAGPAIDAPPARPSESRIVTQMAHSMTKYGPVCCFPVRHSLTYVATCRLAGAFRRSFGAWPAGTSARRGDAR